MSGLRSVYTLIRAEASAEAQAKRMQVVIQHTHTHTQVMGKQQPSGHFLFLFKLQQ